MQAARVGSITSLNEEVTFSSTYLASIAVKTYHYLSITIRSIPSPGHPCDLNEELRGQESLQALSQLRLEVKVAFEDREEPVLGIVTKINRKSVIVLAEDSTKQYNLSPALLRPLRDVK